MSNIDYVKLSEEALTRRESCYKELKKTLCTIFDTKEQELNSQNIKNVKLCQTNTIIKEYRRRITPFKGGNTIIIDSVQDIVWGNVTQSGEVLVGVNPVITLKECRELFSLGEESIIKFLAPNGIEHSGMSNVKALQNKIKSLTEQIIYCRTKLEEE